MNSTQFIKSLEESIVTRFGVPKNFIMENGMIFVGDDFTTFCRNCGIIMGKSSHYYPQGNVVAE
jgi:hypothetical protein